MKDRKRKTFVFRGLGFPIKLINVPMRKMIGLWVLDVNFNKLQKQVLLALCHKHSPLTGNELHFIRTYLEMKIEVFGKQLGVTHVAVLNWEKTKNKPAKIDPTSELYVRLFILEKLKVNNQVFRSVFREFDIQHIAKKQKTSFKEPKPLLLDTSLFAKSTLSFHF